MKSAWITRSVLALGIPLGLVSYLGCQGEVETGSYHEYSESKSVVQPLVAKNSDSKTQSIQTIEIVAPAIAEKPDKTGIAQTSYEPKANDTQLATSAANSTNPLRKPGEPNIAKPDGKPREIKLLVPEKRFSKASVDGTLRVSYDDIDLLKILNMEPVPLDVADYLPEWLEELDGKRIRIRGFMYPAFQETGLQGFVLARDNDICCFGRDPKIYDLIRVVMKDGTTTNYLPNRPFDVVGTFRIVPDSDEGTMFQLYRIEDASVITGRGR